MGAERGVGGSKRAKKGGERPTVRQKREGQNQPRAKKGGWRGPKWS